MTQSRASANACSARAPLVGAERGVRHERRDVATAQRERRAPRPRRGCRTKTSRFSPRCRRGDDRGGVGQAADVVERHLGASRRCGRRVCDHRGRADAARRRAASASSSSGLPTVADRADALQLAAGEAREPLEHGEQVPAAIVAGEGVHLVDDDRRRSANNRAWSTPVRDQHRLQRLGRGEQDVGRVGEDRSPLRPRRRRRATARPAGPTSSPYAVEALVAGC